MANAATTVLETIEGVDSVTYSTIALSSTYATGGETVTPAQFGLSLIKVMAVEVTSAGTAVLAGSYVPSTGKILLRDLTGAQVANGASLTGVTLAVRVLGN